MSTGTRYFRAPTETLNALRADVREFLEQPNPRADEPWPVDGDHAAGGLSYLALAEHHTTGEPWETLVAQGLAIPGVEEIDEATYLAAAPQTEL